MRRDSVSIEDIIKSAKAEVNVLRTQKATLSLNLKELEEKRDKISQEIFDSEKKLTSINEEYKGNVDSILKSAQEKLAKAISREAEISGKLANLAHKQKEAEDLIKSNQGLQKNLILQTEIVKENISVLEGLVATVEVTLKDIK